MPDKPKSRRARQESTPEFASDFSPRSCLGCPKLGGGRPRLGCCRTVFGRPHATINPKSIEDPDRSDDPDGEFGDE